MEHLGWRYLNARGSIYGIVMKTNKSIFILFREGLEGCGKLFQKFPTICQLFFVKIVKMLTVDLCTFVVFRVESLHNGVI